MQSLPLFAGVARENSASNACAHPPRAAGENRAPLPGGANDSGRICAAMQRARHLDHSRAASHPLATLRDSSGEEAAARALALRFASISLTPPGQDRNRSARALRFLWIPSLDSTARFLGAWVAHLPGSSRGRARRFISSEVRCCPFQPDVVWGPAPSAFAKPTVASALELASARWQQGGLLRRQPEVQSAGAA